MSCIDVVLKVRETLTYPCALSEWITGEARRAGAYGIVIRCMAHRADATSVRTRIGALTIDAGAIVWTFRADNAFGSAVWRCADVVRLTRAHCMALVVATIAIGSAWRRLAREVVLSRRKRRWNFLALEEWIAGESGRTCASRNVVGNMTNGQPSANTHARIDALESNTGQAIVAVDIRFTFATASPIHVVRIAFVVGETEASASSVAFTAFSVWSAWRWTAWSSVWFTFNSCRTICDE